MKDLKKWTILQSRMAFEHRWCNVRQDTVQLPTGEIIEDYFLHVRPDIALVFPITRNQEIVFVRQYRHGVSQILLELPAGAFNPLQENAESAALRELQEETGYAAGELIKLAVLYDNPVKDTNRIHLFLAQQLTETGQQELDITEDIEVVLIPASTVMSQVMQGNICVSGSVAAVFLGLQFLQQSGTGSLQ